MLTKEEMLEFCKNGLIPASHIMIHDNENIHLACSLFKVSGWNFYLNVTYT